MIVCHCAGVSDTTIARHIEEGAASVADIARLTGAGRCCAPCRREIANLIDRRQSFLPVASDTDLQVAASL
jgi:bacterioferritin-associated ferredoxin